MSDINIYILGSFVVSSIMMWWFNTNLPIHVVHIIKKLGYRKDDKHFWKSETPIELWTKVDLNEWKQRHLPAWLDELSECPGCLSMHISFWTALFFSILTWHGFNSIVLFFLAWGGWPYIGNIALAILKKIQKN